MSEAALLFNELADRIGEAVVVVFVGTLLTSAILSADALWAALLLFFAIRPAAVLAGSLGTGTSPFARTLIAWFGIRGIGSVYYLSYAMQQGLPPNLASQLAIITLFTITVSIIAHGITATPLMNLYSARKGTPDRPRKSA